MKETLINSAGNYMFKFDNKNTRTRYEIYMFKSNNKDTPLASFGCLCC